MSCRARGRPSLAALAALACGVAVSFGVSGPVVATPPGTPHPPFPAPMSRACPPSADAVAFSDGLDKAVVHGVTVGGLSDIAWDPGTGRYASTVDNHADDPSRIWFWAEPEHARVVGRPLVLRAPDGTPYTGETADNEGLATLPSGRYVVSSETEPSVRIFGRHGLQRAELPVPARFRVAPAGEATANATLEGLTVTPDGRHVVASMEGTLSGDVGTDRNATYRRFLIYHHDAGTGWVLGRQVGYQVQPGNRIAEIQAYGRDGLLVLEAAFDGTAGNAVELYAVHTTGAPDVSGVDDLASAPGRDVMAKTLVADVTACPTLGATAKEPQANPLMDNYEGMTVAPWSWRCPGCPRVWQVTLVSDDNFSATQTTRVLTLTAQLP